MKKINDPNLADYKRRALSRADRDVKNFVGNNLTQLKESVAELCTALNKKDTVLAGKLSYHVSTIAPLYGRSDITNMANFLCKVLKNKDFIDVYDVYKLFSDNFAELMTVVEVQSEMEQGILIKTRETLAKLSAK